MNDFGPRYRFNRVWYRRYGWQRDTGCDSAYAIVDVIARVEGRPAWDRTQGRFGKTDALTVSVDAHRGV